MFTQPELYTDSLHRIAYATDASAYREMPLAVAYPETPDDIRRLLDEARKRHTHLIPRAAGTSIAGQVVGSGIVVDISRHMNRILEINAPQRWVRVQPGVVRDELNIALKPHGLFFSPETSTSNRCCIGGMVGNNSCGTHSLVYGSTRHHVLGLKGVLSDGSDFECTATGFHFSPDSRVGKQVLELLSAWQHDKHIRKLLADNFPDSSLRRRSCGYALDECLNAEQLNLPALLTGSEGTLAFITEITLSLDPLPPAHKALVVRLLDNMDEAWQANLDALAQHPTAVELIDGEILKLALNNPEARRNMEVLHLDLAHLPAALLVSEFWGNEPADLPDKTMVLTAPADIAAVWNLRKAGLGVLTGTDSDAKPIGVIEDTAVAPQRLAAYMHDFRAMMDELGLSCVYYGHISTGELHLRPVLDIKQPRDRQLFREVATRTAQLVKKHRGSLSGEHGDGRLRGEFIPLMYGDEVNELFCRIKDTFDPDGLFNVGKIVRTPPMDKFLRYDLNQQYAVQQSVPAKRTRWLFRGLTGEGSLMQRIERCNGAGDCRKSNRIGGTMCPAFKVSGDEIMTTRARANVLREILTRGKLDKHQLSIVNAQLSSCLACKACRSECPSNVDMTRLRSQVLQLLYDAGHVPFRSWMVARMAVFEAIGSLVPPVYNFFASNRLTSYLLKKLLHFATERRIPTLSRYSMRRLVNREADNLIANGRTVYLFADEFTNRQEAELGLAFARLLRRLGYHVVIPEHVESGRAAISKGCLHLAAKYAVQNVRLLSSLVSEDTPLVGIEPSCILSFRDEYSDLMPDDSLREKALKMAPACLLFDEFLCREIDAGRIDPAIFNKSDVDIWLHGHCHQKSLVGVDKTARLLQYTTSGKVHVIPSGCCGMAGSFGYEKEHYATSMAIGEMILFPAVRNALAQHPTPQHPAPSVIISAPGTSCREQILHATGVTALHPIQILYNAL